MLIHKEIHTILNLVDPEDIYNPDLVSLCKQKLKEKYVNKNFMSCHILDITKIIDVSTKRMNRTLEGGCSLSVYFEVKALQFSRGDILHGCEVVAISSKTELIAKTEFAGIKIICLDTGIYKVGDKIPVILGSINYDVGQPEISATASQFSPTFPETQVFEITEPLTKSTANKYLLDQIHDFETKSMTSDEQKRYKFFDALIFPYKKEKKLSSVKKFDKIGELKKGSIVSFPNELSKSKKCFVLSNEDPTTSISADAFYATILIQYLKHLQALHGFVDAYNFQDIKKHTLMWKTYNMLKK